MVVLEIEILEGDLNLSMFQNLYRQKKRHTATYQIPQINSKAAANLLTRINGNKYKESSKIKLSIVGYLKEPTPNFSMDAQG